MQQDNSKNDTALEDDLHLEDLSSKLSYDASSKFDSSIDGESTLPPDDDNGDDANGNENDDYDDVFAMHSIPHPDELPRTTAKTVERKSGSKAMQTFAGIAGNVLEW